MKLRAPYQKDIDIIMSKRGHLDGEIWTTRDYRIGKGSPFSTRDVAIIFAELGFTRKEQIIQDIISTIFKTWQSDGRFRITPTGSIFPCHTITALRALCGLGCAKDVRLQSTFDHLFNIQHADGGWRCNAVKLGKDSDSDCSNPGTTLEALDAFRYTKYLNREVRLNKAVAFLLKHWELKRPLGPCRFGIGTLFNQVEYPFFRYNLFYYCHALSFYDEAKHDPRFKVALSALEQKLKDGRLIIENPNRRLSRMSFCMKGEPSDLATRRFRQLRKRCHSKNYLPGKPQI